jgi:hypothetical protein
MSQISHNKYTNIYKSEEDLLSRRFNYRPFKKLQCYTSSWVQNKLINITMATISKQGEDVLAHSIIVILCHDCRACSVRLYFQLFVGGLGSYLRYLCLFAYSGIQHILWCVFHLFVFFLCTLCCQFLWIVLFLLHLQYSLTFIYLVYPMLPVSLDCPVFIAPSVFSNIYLSCVPYVASFSGLSSFYCTFGIL